MPEAVQNTWSQVLTWVQRKVPRHSYNTWFKPTRFLTEDDANLTVRVPNRWFADWLRTHYHEVIDEGLRNAQRPGVEVRFMPEVQELLEDDVRPLVAPTADRLPPRRSEVPSGEAPRTHGATPLPTLQGGARLNARYAFDTFVVSSCNQFAHAASAAVAERPSRSYNPLYIYGGVGLGKTHLMQAIGNRIQSEGRLRLHYVSSETFISDLISSIRFERMHEFKERYRNIDVLLIDDIQFLAGKERTQEEFFHTFNALHEAQKQIVITSDVPPKDIPTLEERLRSRFEWGLIADIQPPDVETKVAILRKKAEVRGHPLPDDVALLIASHCGDNIRELEGALTKVVAYSSMSGQPVCVDLARDQLRDLVPPEAPAQTIEGIQKLVANYFGLKVKDLVSRNNSPQVAKPRQVAMYLCKQFTTSSLPETGRRFGKHHSTVLHAIRKVEERRTSDREFDTLVDKLASALK